MRIQKIPYVARYHIVMVRGWVPLCIFPFVGTLMLVSKWFVRRAGHSQHAPSWRGAGRLTLMLCKPRCPDAVLQAELD